MKIAVFLRNRRLDQDARYLGLMDRFRNRGCDVYEVLDAGDLCADTDLFVSVGGDGTFLTSAVMVGEKNIPILGVNLGRLGFLSENSADAVVDEVLAGQYSIEDRTLLEAEITSPEHLGLIHPYALNEITFHRSGPAMLGVDVTIDGQHLPTYWADGLLVATSSGSTAYSLSVGGPIIMPEAKVLIISPISPHNLNVRPLVVPDTSVIEMSLQARDSHALLTLDNRSQVVDRGVNVRICKATFPLKRVRMNGSNFINALTSKLFWGEDIRNGR